MQAQLREGHAPVVAVSLDAGEELVSEAGAMMFTPATCPWTSSWLAGWAAR